MTDRGLGTKRLPLVWGLLAACLGPGLVWSGGCAGSPGRPERLGALPEGPAIVVGDWNDVEAAVRVALSRHELTFARREGRLDSARLVYVIHGIRDERGRLTVERAGDPSEGQVEITISCRLDPATGEARARQVERDVARRIEQLRGEVARPRAW